MDLLSVADYAEVARGKLPKGVLGYYEGGALDEITLRENTAGWERLKLYYRVLAGVGARQMSTTVLGQKISMPICVAPTAFHKLACEQGELATARAAKEAETLFILSSLSNTPMEDVFSGAASPRWFQLYIYKDRGVTAALVQRAEAAGAEAIVQDRSKPTDERFAAQIKLAELPRNSSKTRVRNRCALTGRARGYYRKVKLSRNQLR